MKPLAGHAHVPGSIEVMETVRLRFPERFR